VLTSKREITVINNTTRPPKNQRFFGVVFRGENQGKNRGDDGKKEKSIKDLTGSSKGIKLAKICFREEL
jgi:hypothetical protein